MKKVAKKVAAKKAARKSAAVKKPAVKKVAAHRKPKPKAKPAAQLDAKRAGKALPPGPPAPPVKAKRVTVAAPVKRVSASRRQELFEAAYLVNGMNATQAAITAGYSPKTAASQASRLLRNVKVAEAIGAKVEEALERLDYSVDRVLTEVARIAFLDIAEIFNDDGSMKALKDISADARAAIAGLEVEEEVFPGLGGEDGEDAIVQPSKVLMKKLKLADKSPALDKLMRYHSLYKDKVEITRKIEDLTDEEIDARLAERLKGG